MSEQLELNIKNSSFDIKDNDSVLIKKYEDDLQICPGDYNIYLNLGKIYFFQNNLQLSKEYLIKSINIKENWETIYFLAKICQKIINYDLAIKYYKKVLQLKNDHIDSLYALGQIFFRIGNIAESIFYIRKILEFDKHHKESLSFLLHLYQNSCLWEEYNNLLPIVDRSIDISIENNIKPGECPFTFVTRSYDNEKAYKIAKLWSADIEKNIQGKFNIIKNNFKDKITLGYISKNFQNCATAHHLSGVFQYHDRSKFKVIAYSDGIDDESYYRKKIANDVDEFVDISKLSNLEVAKKINNDSVGILIDLQGYMRGSRLEICALRPAPIQISYLCLVGTSGANFFDYIIADKIILPDDVEKFYSEKFIYLPDTYWPTFDEEKISDIIYQKQDFNIPDDAFVFSSFNLSYKIDQKIFDIWLDILNNVPNSILWLLKSNNIVEHSLKNYAKLKGISEDRIIFADFFTNKAEHLSRLKLIDLVLDTRIYGGHTTNQDALFIGVPVLTILGKHFASRVSASFLHCLKMDELITTSLEEYKQLAIKLALNKRYLLEIKKKLQDNKNRSNFFKTKKYTENLDRAYEKIWQHYINDKQPQHVEV